MVLTSFDCLNVHLKTSKKPQTRYLVSDELWKFGIFKKDMDLGPIPPNHGKFLQKNIAYDCIY